VKVILAKAKLNLIIFPGLKEDAIKNINQGIILKIKTSGYAICKT
jgi:hypothetical protein